VTATTERPPAVLFRRYWTADTVSRTGTAVTGVAMPLVAVAALGSGAFAVSLIVAASFVGWVLVGLPAGDLVGRLPLRELQVGMDVARAVAVASVPLAWWAGVLTVPHLVVAALAVSIASVVFDVGNATFLPLIVPPGELTARNSLISATEAVTGLGGPSLGGLLVQVMGPPAALVVDAVSYVVSAVLQLGLPRAAAPPREPGASTVGRIREGWRFVLRHPVLRPCTVAATAVNFVAGGLMALTPVYLVRTLSTPFGLVGLLVATDGVGSLIGAALTPRLSGRLGSARACVLGCTSAALLVLVLPLGHGGPGRVLFAVGSIGFGAGTVVLSICTRTYRQQATPPELLPRVVATVRFVSWGAVPVGSVLAGGLAEAAGVRPATVVICLLALVAPLVLALGPVGRLRDLADGPPAPA